MREGRGGSRRDIWWDFEHGKGACGCLILHFVWGRCNGATTKAQAGLRVLRLVCGVANTSFLCG